VIILLFQVCKLKYYNFYNFNFNLFILLIIIATSAPVERIFSGGTDLIVQKRCSLKDKTIQEVMCLKGWWKLGFGKPEITNNNNNL